MTPELYIPLLVAVISIVGGGLVYLYQKRVDRRVALAELKRGAYREFLAAFLDMTNTPEKDRDVTNRYLKAEFDLLVIASDSVLKHVSALDRYYGDTNTKRHERDSKKIRELISNAALAMREDCFEKSNLGANELQTLIPLE